MPHGQDIDAPNDPTSGATYECLQCGNVVRSKTHPATCECGGEFQNRANSLE